MDSALRNRKQTSSSTEPARLQFRIALRHGAPATVAPAPATRRRLRSVAAFGLALVVAGTGLSGCKRHHETTGEKIDHFGDKMQDTFDPPKGPGEKAGRTIDRTLHND
ncbi:hypothetical protein B0W47_10885 [Komagataeibacter nataicola]|uniref:Uncharacterized protein n=1 Tax=Komagataeibacter nataicola TaxID=265960 RepID=A0A9N7CM02_9PROT|nr:hypothetical protein [Komagataeibacter nataicola]AQU87893.1 hypothetical protein B0W47_10885 [Komagataeibacter nataicola]PYD66453.1 hypothetical protein CDI09_08120 [Komagataeibacter nataicola]WEQ55636.1 hypothetical protein LV564_16475 [Komagataeibacter nataicola]WNM09492.1 hypothetical protein RI056_05965 [Komagataeibacter nataicola]GBR26522.1 hypothetical protein AA0616_3235 [Komagataeibacter nataicola NRIC 0616]